MEGRWDRIVANLPQWAGVWSLPTPMTDRMRSEVMEIMQTHHDQNHGAAKTIVGPQGTQPGSLCGTVRLGLTNDAKGTMRKRLSTMRRDTLYQEFMKVARKEDDVYQTIRTMTTHIIQHHEDQIALADHAWFNQAHSNAPRPITESVLDSRVAQTCSFVGSVHGRVLTNVLDAKRFKRQIPITDLQPPPIVVERAARHVNKICHQQAFSAGQGVWKCEVASAEIGEMHLSEQDKLEIMCMPYTRIDGVRVNFA